MCRAWYAANPRADPHATSMAGSFASAMGRTYESAPSAPVSMFSGAKRSISLANAERSFSEGKRQALQQSWAQPAQVPDLNEIIEYDTDMHDVLAPDPPFSALSYFGGTQATYGPDGEHVRWPWEAGFDPKRSNEVGVGAPPPPPQSMP